MVYDEKNVDSLIFAKNFFTMLMNTSFPVKYDLIKIIYKTINLK